MPTSCFINRGGLSQLKKYPFLKKSLVCRIGIINLYIGNREEGIRSGKLILTNAVSKLSEATAYQALGILHISESYDVAYRYLAKALTIYSEMNSGNINPTKQSINFLQNYWRKEPEYLDFNS